MIGYGSATVQSDGAFGTASRTNGQMGTLILDRMGRIVSCGEPAENILADSQSRLIGRGISEFICGLCLGGTSPSYNSRYLDYLCGDGVWRKFEARDVVGEKFLVELSLSPIVTEGQRLFLLHLRCGPSMEGPMPQLSASTT